MDVVIRQVTETDLPTVLQLIRDLAVYEREPNAVVVTEETFQAYFRDKKFESLVAEMEGKVVGIALYYTAYSTWKGPYIYLEDFIITESLRGKGIGKALLRALVQVAEDRKSPYIKWQVLDWNEPAIKFYENIQAELSSEWVTGWLHKDRFKAMLG